MRGRSSDSYLEKHGARVPSKGSVGVITIRIMVSKYGNYKYLNWDYK